MLSRSHPRAARAGFRRTVTDFDGNSSDELDEQAPYAQPNPKYVQPASSDPVTETPDDTSDGAPRESPDHSSDECPGESPEESGDEWSGDPPEESDDESDESPDASSEVASRKRGRDDDSDEHVAKRTNQTSESSEGSDVDEPSDSAPAAFDEEKARAAANSMTVKQIKKALGAFGQKQNGLKDALVERLVDAQRESVPVRKSNVTSPSTPSMRRPSTT